MDQTIRRCIPAAMKAVEQGVLADQFYLSVTGGVPQMQQQAIGTVRCLHPHHTISRRGVRQWSDLRIRQGDSPYDQGSGDGQADHDAEKTATHETTQQKPKGRVDHSTRPLLYSIIGSSASMLFLASP